MKRILRLALLLFSPLVVMTAGFLYFHASIGIEQIENRTENNALALLNRESHLAAQPFMQISDTLNGIAATSAEFSKAKLVSTTFLNNIRQVFSDHVEGTLYVSADGMAYGDDGSVFDISERPFFEKILKGKLSISPIMESRDSRHPVVAIFAPLKGQENEILGALGATVDVSSPLERLTRTRFGRTGIAIVATPSGRVLSSAKKQSKSINPSILDWQTSIWKQRYAPLLQKMGHTSIGHTQTEIDGELRSAIFTTVPLVGWRFALVMDESEPSLNAKGILHSAIAIISMMIITLFTIAFFIDRKILNPIRAFTLAQQAFGKGDFRVRIEETSKDEIGELQRSFNLMASHVEQEFVEHTNADNALTRSEDRYRNLVELAPIPIFVHRDKRFVYVNPAALKLHLATSPSQLLGKRVSELVIPEQRDEFDSAQSEATEVPSKSQLRIKRFDGRVIDIESTRIRVSYAGEPATLVICTDVTERNMIEQEKIRIEQQVQHTQKLESLAMLAGGIAHDFNNMLATILGNADLARLEIDDPAEVLDAVDQIKLAAKRASELTNQMLAYSGKGQFIVRPIELNELIDEMNRSIKAAGGKDASIHVLSNNESCWFSGDSAQMRQVVINLVTNAAEALSETKSNISIEINKLMLREDELEDNYAQEKFPTGEYIVLEIRDDGHGMDSETRNRIFDPFFSTKFTGRGLGLAAVLGIVRGHGGTILVESKLGRGTSFQVILPSIEPAPRHTDSIYPLIANWTGSGTVLVADDEPGVINVARRMLERHNFSVVTAEDGQSTLNVYLENKKEVVCVLLDMTMPDMTGDEVFTKLRAINPKLPIILCSGYSEQEVVDSFPAQGPSAFLHKPFGFERLIDTLRRALDSPV